MPLVDHAAGETFLGPIRFFRQRTLLGIHASIALGSLIGMGIFHYSGVVIATTAVAILLGALGLWLAHRGRTGPAVAIAAVVLVGMPLVLAWSAHGLQDVSMLILPASVVAIGLVARPRATLLTGLLAVASAAFLALATANDFLPRPPSPAEAELAMRAAPVVMVILAFATFIGVTASWALNFLLDALATQNADLERAVQRRTAELEASNAELEAAVDRIERASRELVRSERLATLGSAVSGVTHELATPIGNAVVAASALEDAAAELGAKMTAGTLRKSELEAFVTDARDHSALLMRSLDRARDLVQSFKRVSVDQASGRRRAFMLDECIADLARTFKASKGHRRMVLETRIEPGIELQGYPGPLGQIVTNLLQNAILHGLAGRTDGRIAIEGRRSGTGFELEVIDNGAGIAPEVIEQIFEPYFTTRGDEEGSGLGLSISRQLAATVLGGRLSVESTPGEGARFLLRAPLSAPLRRDDPE
jgi:signal transduction histidine kinase